MHGSETFGTSVPTSSADVNNIFLARQSLSISNIIMLGKFLQHLTLTSFEAQEKFISEDFDLTINEKAFSLFYTFQYYFLLCY